MLLCFYRSDSMCSILHYVLGTRFRTHGATLLSIELVPYLKKKYSVESRIMHFGLAHLNCLITKKHTGRTKHEDKTRCQCDPWGVIGEPRIRRTATTVITIHLPATRISVSISFQYDATDSFARPRVSKNNYTTSCTMTYSRKEVYSADTS